MAPDCERQRRSAATRSAVGARHRAQQHVGVPGQRSSCRDSIAKSAPSASGRWPSGVATRVVDRQQRAGGVRGLADGRDVADVQARVRRRLDPHERGAVGRLADRLGVGRDEAASRCRAAPGAPGPARGRRGVAVGAAPRARRPARSVVNSTAVTAAMPEAKTTASPPSSSPMRALEVRPRRVAVAPVAVRARRPRRPRAGGTARRASGRGAAARPARRPGCRRGSCACSVPWRRTIALGRCARRYRSRACGA